MVLALLSALLLTWSVHVASIETAALRDAAVPLIRGQTARNKSTVDFLFLGDWGVPGVNQTLVANQMGNWSEQHLADFVVSLGDNFYGKVALHYPFSEFVFPSFPHFYFGLLVYFPHCSPHLARLTT